MREGSQLRQDRELLPQAQQPPLAPQHPAHSRSSRVEHPAGPGLHLLHSGRQGGEGLRVALQGVVQTYDPATGVGIVVRDDDRSEVFLRPGSLAGSIFRTLRQGQRIIFDVTEDEGAVYASGVRVGQDRY